MFQFQALKASVGSTAKTQGEPAPPHQGNASVPCPDMALKKSNGLVLLYVSSSATV